MSQILEKTWAIYTQSWREPVADKRLRIFQEVLTETCVYTDPNIQVTGYTQLAQYMDDFQKMLPGGHFEITAFKTHHQQSFAEWNMLDGQGKFIQKGVSFGRYGADQKLLAMTGFF